jgi:prophage regulatory protein
MKLLKAKDVAVKTSFSIPHIRRMAKEGRFPMPIQISEARSGWLEEDVENWISECIRKHKQGV